MNKTDEYIRKLAEIAARNGCRFHLGMLRKNLARLGLKSLRGTTYATNRAVAQAVARAYRIVERLYGQAEAAKIADAYIGNRGHCWK